MFERFTDRARRVVVLAQEEARLLSHNYIGTEHILLGLLHEGEGVSAQALQALDISLEAVRQKVEEIIGRGQQAPSGHIPFTPRAKKVLELSLREALQLGRDYIGPEHILLGLVREGEGVGAQVLVRLGADLNRVRQQVIQLLPSRESEALDEPGYPQRPREARRVRSAVRARVRAFAGGEDVVTEITWLDALEIIGERLAAIEARLGMAAWRPRSRTDLESEIARLNALLREHGIDPGGDQEADPSAEQAAGHSAEPGAERGSDPGTGAGAEPSTDPAADPGFDHTADPDESASSA